jgi:hypothetical protein
MSRLLVGALSAGLITVAVPMEAGASVSVKQQWALSGSGAGVLFGFDTALQSKTLVVGDANHGVAGAVFVYMKINSSWVKEATLTGKDSAGGDGFGNAVALEGRTLVVGAQGHNGAHGAVYVFTGSGKSWTQTQELTVTPAGTYGQFGWSVAISGSTIVAGAPNVSGAAFVFTKSGLGKWTLRKQLTASDETNGDGFGYTLALNGSTLFAGSPFHGATAGSVYVFTGSGGSWKQRTEFRGRDTVASDNFGIGELAASGTDVLVGAPLHAAGAGASYVFTGSGSKWKQQAELKGKDTVAGDHFGFGEAIDGSTIVVGADRHAPGGMAYVFTRSGTAWKQQAEFKGKDTAAGDVFGRWVSLSVAGSVATVAVGAPEHATNIGRVYIFRA